MRSHAGSSGKCELSIQPLHPKVSPIRVSWNTHVAWGPIQKRHAEKVSQCEFYSSQISPRQCAADQRNRVIGQRRRLLTVAITAAIFGGPAPGSASPANHQCAKACLAVGRFPGHRSSSAATRLRKFSEKSGGICSSRATICAAMDAATSSRDDSRATL
jgi:hypothetical protein